MANYFANWFLLIAFLHFCFIKFALHLHTPHLSKLWSAFWQPHVTMQRLRLPSPRLFLFSLGDCTSGGFRSLLWLSACFAPIVDNFVRNSTIFFCPIAVTGVVVFIPICHIMSSVNWNILLMNLLWLILTARVPGRRRCPQGDPSPALVLPLRRLSPFHLAICTCLTGGLGY